jgi:hypothetical protein
MTRGDGFSQVDGVAWVKGDERNIAAPGRFVDDVGAPDRSIREASNARSLIDALRGGRVIVAVVAIADEVGEVSGLRSDKSSDMSVVSMVAADGRRGLLAFTGIDALRAWDPLARPVPVLGRDAAQAAISDNCEALVLDVAGPRPQVVPEVDLVAVAGLDRWEHARTVTTRILAEQFGEGRVWVTQVGERLQVTPSDISIVPEDLAASITPRILSLVPEGIEVVGA